MLLKQNKKESRKVNSINGSQCSLTPPASGVFQNYLFEEKERLSTCGFRDHRLIVQDFERRYLPSFAPGLETLDEALGDYQFRYLPNKLSCRSDPLARHLHQLAGLVLVRLARFLVEQGNLDEEGARLVIEPAKFDLSDESDRRALELLRAAQHDRPVDDDAHVEDRFMVARVERGALWLDPHTLRGGQFGPIVVEGADAGMVGLNVCGAIADIGTSRRFIEVWSAVR
jgi:hypothetical protein